MTLLLYLQQIPFTYPLIKPSYYWWRHSSLPISLWCLCVISGLHMWLVWGNGMRQKWQSTSAQASRTSAWALLPPLSPQGGLVWAFLLGQEGERNIHGAEPTCRWVTGPVEPQMHEGAQPKSAGPHRCMRNHWLFFICHRFWNCFAKHQIMQW